MNEATPVPGKVIPPTVYMRGVNNSKGPKQKMPQEMEHTPAHQDKSPPKKKKKACSKPSALDSADLFERTVAGANREVSMLFSKYAEVLSERAAADASQVKELEGILTEARSLESHLKEKKDHLRRTLALISDKLQG
ncbi:testis-expressed protein 12 [Centroberyx affinis]|uniref:testis-expressed protein 12 n=1 Tax=Centroberyx affinis TaxID=166261 RepID=UPI003A5BEA0A